MKSLVVLPLRVGLVDKLPELCVVLLADDDAVDRQIVTELTSTATAVMKRKIAVVAILFPVMVWPL